MGRTSSRSHGRPRGRQAPSPRASPPHLGRERLAERVREEQRTIEEQRIIEEAQRRGREDRGTRRRVPTDDRTDSPCL